MSRMHTGNRAYFKALLVRTFRGVILLSQWCCTAPYPLEPYQQFTRYHRTIVCKVRRLLSGVLFGVIFAAPFVLYYLDSGQIYVYSIPLSIKLMYYVQTAIQTGSMGYLLLVYQFRTSFHRFYFERLVCALEDFGRPNIDARLHALERNIRRILPAILVYIILIVTAYILREQSWNVLPKIVIFLATQLMSTSLTLLYVAIFGTVSILLRQMNDTLEGILLGVPIIDKSSANCSLVCTTPVRLTRDDERTVEKIRLLQLKLLNIVLRINGGEYGQLLIMILLATFIFLNTELLQLYQGIKAGAFSFAIIGSKLLNSAHKIAMLFMFAYPNRLIQTQNIRGLKVLYQLSQPGNDSRCSEIANRFITQTTLFLEKAHEAYGMVSIDMTLLLSIIGGLTNILVVLVQFSDAKPSSA
uniref:Gustatory receptor n=1 Tax=Anopheles minimus TaxID=112268 RepID=A0A182WQZ3_9DIPT